MVNGIQSVMVTTVTVNGNIYTQKVVKKDP